MRVVLGPIIGAAAPTSASIWFQLDQEGEVIVVLTAAAGATQEALEAVATGTLLTGTVVFRGLTPGTRYDVAVRGPAGDQLARGSFVTLDEAPQKFAFTFSSCHRPAAYAGAASTYALWSRLADKIGADKDFSRLHLHVGDQIYADPVYDDLFTRITSDPAAHLRARRDQFASVIAEATERYVRLYQEHWSPPDVQRVLGSVPNLMLWDDHDIADGWGSRASSGWDIGQALFKAASRAYRFFQDAHNPVPGQFPKAFAPSETVPVNYGFGMTVGPNIAFLCPDQRTFRQTYNPTANHETGQHPVFGDRQAQDIADWLSTADAKVLFFVATVPFFHTSPGTIGIGGSIEQLDALDNWITTTNRRDLAFILEQLFTWKAKAPGRLVIVLGGDVHMADAATIERKGDAIVQLVSSPITNAPSGGILEKLLVAQSGESFSVQGIDATFNLKFHQTVRNFGRVLVDTSGATPTVTYEIYIEGAALQPIAKATATPTTPWLKI